MGVVAAWPLGHYAALSGCSVRDIQQPQRREQCERISTVLYEQDSTALGRAVGAAIGQRLGWPPEKQQRIRDLVDADLEALERSGEINPRLMLSCSTSQWASLSIQDVARHGELGAMERRILRSGETTEALAEAARQRRTSTQRVR
jgi:hypothetical protein